MTLFGVHGQVSTLRPSARPRNTLASYRGDQEIRFSSSFCLKKTAKKKLAVVSPRPEAKKSTKKIKPVETHGVLYGNPVRESCTGILYGNRDSRGCWVACNVACKRTFWVIFNFFQTLTWYHGLAPWVWCTFMDGSSRDGCYLMAAFH